MLKIAKIAIMIDTTFQKWLVYSNLSKNKAGITKNSKT